MNNLRFFIALVVLTFASKSSQQRRQIDPEIERKINEYIHNVYLPEANVTTLGLTIVQNDGETLYTNGYGWANEEKQIPNTNDTKFLIASVTKSFTAVVLINALHEKFPELGETVLDTPIRKLLPEYNFTLIDRFRSEHGTVRDLLAHRLCVPRTDFIYDADAIDSIEEIAYRQRYNEEVCGIRSDFQYQNQIYVLAGEILSYLSGKPVEETVEDFLRELGMETSRFTRRTDDFVNTPELARPYYVDVKDGILKPVSPEQPIRAVTLNAAGGLLVSSNEMERYLRFHMNLGMLDGKQIVPQEVIMWMRKPAIFTPTMFGSFAYGQGFFLYEYKGWEYIHHSGGLPPYQTLLSIFPQQNLSIFTASNIGPLQLDPTVLHAFIFETLNGADNPEHEASIVAEAWKLRQEQKKKTKNTDLQTFLKEKASCFLKGTDPASEPIGKYGSGAAGDAEIVEKWNEETNQTGLYLTYGKHGNGWVKLVEFSIYRIVFDTDIISQGFNGQLDLFWLVGNAECIEFILLEGEEFVSFGVFYAGVSLDKLPPIPWLPESCPA